MANTGKDASNNTIYFRAPFGTGVDNTNAYVYGSALYFERNGVEEIATLDTTTSANNRPIPVVLLANDSGAPVAIATAANQTTTNDSIGATNVAAATSDTGTFSLLALIKRVLSRIFSTKTNYTGTIAVSGDTTAIAAPSAGIRIVITGFSVQNNSTTGTTILIKDGSSTTLQTWRTTGAIASGVSQFYPLGSEIRLTAATALVVNLSGANSHIFNVQYYLETASTGLPV